MVQPKYTLHEHRARRAGFHLDLRLQKGNDVYSFALPKSTLPDGQKIFLAILSHVDRNNLSALTFVGSISNGEYGSGSLSIRETGTYKILDWPSDNSKIVFEIPRQFNYQDLFGRYYLVKTSNENNFIFGKKGITYVREINSSYS